MMERMQGGGSMRSFPPEMHQKGRQGREELPPEMRRRVEELKERRRRQGAGSQRDVPPPDEWDDRRRPFEGGPDRNNDE